MKKGMNAQEVLREVESKIEYLEKWRDAYKSGHTWQKPRLDIGEIYSELSIFDWWNEYLSIAQLKDMRKFLKEAIKLGYIGYACFKVGAAGCSNGMWAYKEESETGYSPDGECLYKSFTPSYNYWQVYTERGEWIPNDKYDSIKTTKQLESLLEGERI